MLQIRLNSKVPSSDGGGGAKPLAVDTVTVACPDHLVLADLPVAKSVGSVMAASLVKTVGRRSRRQLGERVHFCVRCDFPIAIYGRLSPCEHAFCLDCARSDSICYLCDERIQKIQTIKMMEGIFICAAPHCLKSFLKQNEFMSHIHEKHVDLLHPNTEKDGNESEAMGAKRPTASDSTVQAPPWPVFSPSSNSHLHDREGHRLQQRDQPPPWPVIQPKLTPPAQVQNHPSELQPDNNGPPGFDMSGSLNRFSQQSFDSQGGMQQESGQFPDQQQGILSRTSFPEYPMHPHQPPSFTVPITPNPGLAPPPFHYPPFAPEGSQPFYGAPYEMPRPDSAPEVGSEQGSLLGFPPGPAHSVNFSENYPRSWNLGPVSSPFESSPTGQVIMDGFSNTPDSQGRVGFFQGDYGHSPRVLPSGNRGMEPVQGGNAMSMDPRDGKGILAPQPLSLPPPPPLPPPHTSQLNQGKFYSGDMGHDGQGFGWQNEKRDTFGNGQD